MLISEMIAELEKAKAEYGDMPLTTYDGFIGRVRFTPAKDGICYPLKRGAHNELGFEIETRP